MKNLLLTLSLVTVSAIAISSCTKKEDAANTATTTTTTTTEAAPAAAAPTGGNVTQLKIEDLKVGTGDEAKPGQTVSVHYTGWLTNGNKFDSSVDRGQPFQFKLGQHQVIAGWDEGVKGMKVGGKRKLTIPPDMGYGAGGAGPIPPNSTLIFDVELLGVTKSSRAMEVANTPISAADYWRKCNSCKKPIGFRTKYWVCSVSTCTRKRTGLVFCKVACWDAHAPMMNHRDAGAIEMMSPSKAEWEQENNEVNSHTTEERKMENETPAESTGAEVLVVASKLKNYIRDKSGMNTSAAVMEALSNKLRQLCDLAIENAKREGRKTVMDRDFM